MTSKKLEFCLRKTKECLDSLSVTDARAEPLLRFARDYYGDALHYRESDPETALEAVAYAHGFIDAAVLLGFAEIKGYHLQKEKVKKK
jgi:hypothetical protein